MSQTIIPYGKVETPASLGRLLRQRRKSDRLTQAEAAALCGVGTRFLSELERGKATAELGKVLRVLRGLGLELAVTPRGGGGG
jgi:HTH-type transcriptional regulator/antitoxin HipB